MIRVYSSHNVETEHELHIDIMRHHSIASIELVGPLVVVQWNQRVLVHRHVVNTSSLQVGVHRVVLLSNGWRLLDLPSRVVTRPLHLIFVWWRHLSVSSARPPVQRLVTGFLLQATGIRGGVRLIWLLLEASVLMLT